MLWRIPKACYNIVFNFLFYLPCGGETSFRETCVKFASLVAKDRVLDLCCGTGELTTVIASKGFTEHLVGVDISESAIEMARIKTRHIPITYITASAGDLPFDSSRFDKCFISFGLHHMSRCERQKTLAEVHRTLIPKGTLLIIDYNLPRNGVGRLAAIIFAKLDKSKEAYKIIKTGNYIKEVKHAGFEISRRCLTCQGIIQLLAVIKN
ncbi:MAG: class I SAM-dependent methyltransferase [Dehalococcoidia bacterium]